MKVILNKYIICILILGLLLIGCGKTDDYLQLSGDSVRLELSKGPIFKAVNDLSDVEEVVELLESIYLIENRKNEDINGYVFTILLYDTSDILIEKIHITDDLMNFEGRFYQISEDVVKNMEKLYDELDYDEKQRVKNE